MLLWKAIKGLGLVIGLLIVGLGWLLWQGLCLLWQVVLGIADAMEPAPADRSAPGESQKVFTSVQPPLSIFALWSYRETSMVLNSLNIQYCPCWGFSYLDGQLVISGGARPCAHRACDNRHDTYFPGARTTCVVVPSQHTVFTLPGSKRLGETVSPQILPWSGAQRTMIT